MGSAAAATLAGRGRRVLGFERFTPAHTHGSGHGDSRVIRQSYFEDPSYVPLLLRAYELWEGLERATGAKLFTQTGGLFFGDPDSTVVAGSLRSARTWDLPHDELTATEIAARFPTARPRRDEIGMFETRAGFVRPEATIAAQLDLATRRGADLRFEEPALTWTATDGGVSVTTGRGTYTADRLVVTPGSWAPDLLTGLGLPLRVTRQVLFWFQPAGPKAAFDVATHPVFIHENAAGLQLYGFPRIDGPGGPVKIAFFRVGKTTTPQAIDRRVHPHEIAEMRAASAPVFPALAGELVRTATCMYTNTPDEHFVVSAHPHHPSVVVGCGFSGHGFKFVPVIGEILADLATNGTTSHSIALFDPLRPALTGPVDASRRKLGAIDTAHNGPNRHRSPGPI